MYDAHKWFAAQVDDANATLAAEGVVAGGGRWRLPTNRTGLDAIGSEYTHAVRASGYSITSGISSAWCVGAMILASIFRLSQINKRLGVTAHAFLMSFSVRALGACALWTCLFRFECHRLLHPDAPQISFA